MSPHPHSKRRDSKEIPSGFKGRFERQRAEEADRKCAHKRRRSFGDHTVEKSPASIPLPAPVKKKRLERSPESEIRYFGRKIGMSIETTVAVVREGRGMFNVEETLQVRRFIMDRMLDEMTPISFIDSGLMRGSTLFLMTCGSSEEASLLVKLCHKQAKDRYRWLFCRAEDLPLPPRIRGTVLGLSLQKDKLLKFMKLVNHKLGLSIDKWTLVGFDRDRFGQRTSITIEVPDKDAEIVRRIGTLGVELTQVNFRVLPVQRWGDSDESIEESSTSSPHSPTVPTDFNQIELPNIDNSTNNAHGFESIKDSSIFPDAVPPIRTSLTPKDQHLHEIKLPLSFPPLTEPLTPTSPVNRPKSPPQPPPEDLYSSPGATVDEAFARTWKGMENFENM